MPPIPDEYWIRDFQKLLRARKLSRENQLDLDLITTTEEKRKYVKRQGQTRDHHCHWPGCGASVPPAMWGCSKHWFMLPKVLRDRIWKSFRPGQETNWTPSREYLDVAHEVQRWIKENYDAKD